MARTASSRSLGRVALKGAAAITLAYILTPLVFVTWLASREGLEVYARAAKWPTPRNDIDEKSFVTADSIPDPAASYFDLSDWEFTVTRKEQARRRIKELLSK